MRLAQTGKLVSKQLVFVSLLLGSITPCVATPAEMIGVYPTGSISKVEQVRVSFSSDMVPLGDPRVTTPPIELSCSLKSRSVAQEGETDESDQSKRDALTVDYQMRWATTREFILDIKAPIPTGADCTLKPTANLLDLSKQVVKANATYTFNVRSFELVSTFPGDGADIDPEQYFLLRMNAPIDKASIIKSAYFEVSGFPDKWPVQMITPSREQLVQLLQTRSWQFQDILDTLKKNPKTPLEKIDGLNQFILIASDRRFPDGANVVLHLPTDIKSQFAEPLARAENPAFTVFYPFKAVLNCERAQADRACLPILPITLNFSRPIKKDLLRATQASSQGKTWIPQELSDSASQNVSSEDFISTLTFMPPFPSQETLTLSIPKGLVDELGRPLTNQDKFPLKIKIDEAPPLVKFSAQFGLVESQPEALLPVSVRNVEKTLQAQRISTSASMEIQGKSISFNSLADAQKIMAYYKKLQYLDLDRGQSIFTQLNQKNNQDAISKNLSKFLGFSSAQEKMIQPFTIQTQGSKKEIEVIGIPLKLGFHIVEIASPRLGEALLAEKKPMYVSTTALVTNLSVHFKKGKESSLVWVTSLSEGKPVNNVSVVIMNTDGALQAQGQTNEQGVVRFSENDTKCRTNNCELFVFAHKDNDLSFVSDQWKEGIEPYRFNVSYDSANNTQASVIEHTVLDRRLAKQGDTIQMKHVLRQTFSNGFLWLDAKDLPRQVIIRHEGSNTVYHLPFTIDRNTGNATNTFKIPPGAALGRYTILLSKTPITQNKAKKNEDDYESVDGIETGYFVVADYRLPTMQGHVRFNQDRYVLSPESKNEKLSMIADVSVHYLSGGAASFLPAKWRTQYQSTGWSADIEGIEDASYQFFSDPVSLSSLKTEAAEQDNFYTGNEEDNIQTQSQTSNTPTISTQQIKLDRMGGASIAIADIPTQYQVQQIRGELEYQDANGEIKVSKGQSLLFPSSIAIGFKQDDWYGQADNNLVEGIIVDLEAKPKASQNYSIHGFQRQYITHRKRLVGGFYAYDSQTVIKDLGEICQGQTDQKGQFKCRLETNASSGNTLLPSGEIILQASTQDAQKRPSYSTQNKYLYAPGEDYWWGANNTGDRIDLIADHKQYSANQTAKIVVRSPFATATALVTVEREGVLDYWVVPIKRDVPHIEVPIKNGYAPNVFISVVLVRGRVKDIAPTGLIDLGKPAMKMGLVELKIGHEEHRLGVEVKTDRTLFHPRDEVNVSVKVVPPIGQTLGSNPEVALIAVDDALSLLKRNDSVSVLEAMMRSRSLSVETSSGQNQVMGKRHFGLKAMALGGDMAGNALANSESRELFEPVILWSPTLKLERQSDGSATVQTKIKLNDALTRFRITAVATAGTGQFGSSETTIESRKDLIIYSGVSPVIRAGDQSTQAITIRNTTDEPMNVDVKVSLAGLLSENLPNQSLQLPAHQAQTISIPLNVPLNHNPRQTIQVLVEAISGAARDKLSYPVKVEAPYPARVLQADLWQLNASNATRSIPVSLPEQSPAQVGGISISATTSLASQLDGVKRYMSEYPYTCLEQRLSKAVSLDQTKEVQKIVKELPSFTDKGGLLKFFASSICGSPQLTKYVLDVLNEVGQTVSPDIKKTLTQGLGNYISGQYQCRGYNISLGQDRGADELKVRIFDTLSRYQSFDSQMLMSIQITPNLWHPQTLVSWYQLLKREQAIPKRAEYLAQVDQLLRQNIHFDGSLINLQSPGWSWYLFTSDDQTLLDIFNIALTEPSWQNDVGRIARGLTARMRQGHWDSTISNTFATIYFKRFSTLFEKDPVSGSLEISTAGSATNNNASLVWPAETIQSTKSTKPAKKPTSLKPTTINWSASWTKLGLSSQSAKKQNVSINLNQQGTGNPWIRVESSGVLPLKSALDMGYLIARKVSPVAQATPNVWRVGDIAEIELIIKSQADQPWVVIRDPIPAGASHLGGDTDGESDLLDKQASPNSTNVSNWWAEYTERSNTFLTSYASYVYKGSYRMSYRIRLNTAGVFILPHSRVEAMYNPEMFGELPIEPWVILPALNK